MYTTRQWSGGHFPGDTGGVTRLTYTLYGNYSTATFGPHAVLEEADLPYTLELIDLSAGDNHAPDFLAMNPGGYVPVLRCKDGTVLFEAAAIVLYLADQHQLTDLAPPPKDPTRGLLYRSLFFLTSTVQEAYKHFYYPMKFTAERSAAEGIKEQSIQLMVERWAMVEQMLDDNGPYFLGDRFSLADIYLVMLISWHDNMESILATNPAVKRNFDLVTARPALQSILRDHGITA